MTERPMWDGGPGEHPDEGTIHAWLDHALDAASAERVEAHVRGCAVCAALAAEARGLIAGASRVVASLDDVPAGTRPVWAQSEVAGGGAAGGGTTGGPTSDVPGADRSLWRRLRVTPARAAIAATILVMVGLTLTHERIAKESVVPATLPAGHTEPRSEMGAMAAAPRARQLTDSVLDSAVARNLSIAQGRPRMEAATQPAIPQAPPPGTAPVEEAPMTMAEQRVAAGRAAAQAQRDTTGAAADKLRVGAGREITGAVASIAVDEAAVGRSARREMAGAAPMSGAVANVSQGYADAAVRSCYSLESTQGGAMWGDQPLPLVVVVDSGPAVGTRTATLRSAATGTEVRAAWVRSGKDSVAIMLQRVGMTGTIALGPDAGGRAGTASSGAIAAAAEVAMAAPRADAAAPARAKSAKPSAPPSAAPSPAPSRLAPGSAPLHVTLRPIPCPVR
ncbi:MAG TPA: zf-HC2 domain-containing protein [Gemmatimonadaceae bacterium]